MTEIVLVEKTKEDWREGRGPDRLRRRAPRHAGGSQRSGARGAAARRRLRRRAARRPGRARARSRRRSSSSPEPHGSCSRPAAPASRRATSRPRRRETCSSARRPGIAEAIRADARSKTPHALLSRGVAGLVGATRWSSTSPGSPGGCRDGYAVLRPALEHGLELAAGEHGHATPADVSTAPPRSLAASSPSSGSSTPCSRCRSPTSARSSRSTGAPGGGDLLWITLAMVGARTLAMGAEPPRRRRDRRAQPAYGRARAAGGRAVATPGRGCSAVSPSLVYLVAVSQLDPIVRWLWPIPVAMFVVYPYLKRVTWLCHLWLGACLGLAPVGAWLAVAGTAPWEAWAARRRRAPCGSPASTSSTRSSTSSTTVARGCTRGPRDSASAGCSSRRARPPRSGRSRSSPRVGAGLGLGAAYWLGVAAVACAPRLRAPDRPAGSTSSVSTPRSSRSTASSASCSSRSSHSTPCSEALEPVPRRRRPAALVRAAEPRWSSERQRARSHEVGAIAAPTPHRFAGTVTPGIHRIPLGVVVRPSGARRVGWGTGGGSG